MRERQERAPVPRTAYSIAETAQALGLCERTIKKMLADGRLPKMKRLGVVRIPVWAVTGEREVG